MDPERRSLIGNGELTPPSPRRPWQTSSGTSDRSLLQGGGLSLIFATLCIVDLFGVFPIIALPRTIVNCGWMGLPLAFFVFSIQVYTAVLLGRCWIIAENLQPEIIYKSRYPYAALAQLTFGRNTGRFVTVLLDVTIFGAGVPNLLVASQNLELVGLKTSAWQFDFSYCYWMIILGVCLCPVMWLGSPKDMKWLTGLSVVVVVSVSLLTWSCMAFDDTVIPPVPPPAPSWETIAIAYGVLAFQFDVHPMILTVQVDMREKHKIGYAIIGGFLLTGTLFTVTTGLALGWYGTSIRNNLLKGLPGSIWLYVDVVLVTAQICLSMAVGGCAFFQDLEDKLGVPREFNWKRMVLRSLLLMSAVFLGEAVPRFDLVMGLIGGALTGPLMFIMPPLLYARLRSMQTKRRIENMTKPPPPPIIEDISTPPTPPTPPTPSSTMQRRAFLAGTHLSGDPGRKTPFFRDGLPGSPADPDMFFRSSDGLCSRLCSRLGHMVDSVVSMADSINERPFTVTDMVLTTSIVLVGVAATFVSTYFSVVGTIEYAQFTPPCIS